MTCMEAGHSLTLISAAETYQFSIISLRALAGLWMTSPAAILFTTVSSNFLIEAAIFYSLRVNQYETYLLELDDESMGGIAYPCLNIQIL